MYQSRMSITAINWTPQRHSEWSVGMKENKVRCRLAEKSGEDRASQGFFMIEYLISEYLWKVLLAILLLFLFTLVFYNTER